MITQDLAATLTVTDEIDSRPDLAQRGETKYHFTNHDIATLRSVLRRGATAQQHAGPVSLVRSLYFDDVRLRACRDNLDGLAVRNKVRLRWYDEQRPTGPAWFEIKWRRNLATGKHRFRVREAARLFELPLRDIPRALERHLPARLAPLVQRAEEPVALVEYHREHFVLGDARFTLDYDIRFYPLLGQRRFARRFPERLLNDALIEYKAPLGSSAPEHRVLRPLNTRPARFSKYVTACQRLGYVSDL